MLYALIVAGTTLAVSTTLWAGNWQGGSDDNVSFISTQMVISVQSGWNVTSAWTDRGDIAKSSAMTPLGDGSFQLRLDLVPGGQYNYLFWMRGSTNTVASGFANGTLYQEPVPNTGNDMGTFYSLSSNTVQNNYVSSSAVVGYGSVNGDGRRIVRMPDVSPGTTVFLYNNFASTPTGVANTDVNIKEDSVNLIWKGAQGYWGSGTGSPDILGGRTRIFVSTNNVAGPYTQTANLAGNVTYYNHGPDNGIALVQGTSYFFVFVTSDTYTTPYPASYAFNANLVRDGLVGIGDTLAASNWKNTGNYNDLQGKPAARVPTFFKVQKPDLDYILAHDSLVYLTPEGQEDNPFAQKIAAKLVVAYLPKKNN